MADHPGLEPLEHFYKSSVDGTDTAMEGCGIFNKAFHKKYT